ENEIRGPCLKSQETFLNQSILLELEAPLKTRVMQSCQKASLLFIGDYVHRGKQSLETISLLLAYKIKYPEKFFLLRGNHECASINRIYGFYDESAIADEKIFCCHGDQGLLCDLLWSDPDRDVLSWGENDRGVSTFDAEVVVKFLHKHNLDLICKAHQRQLVTLFSMPNYCREFDNARTMMSVNKTHLMCSFQILKPAEITTHSTAEKKKPNAMRPITPPRGIITKQTKK
ncbi:hypothetical protein FD754_011841, partial [Muntiacus muntjak]